VRHQSGIFKAVVDNAKEAFYTSKESEPLKDQPLFASSSEEESNDGGLVSCLAGEVKQTAYGLVIRLYGLKQDGKREAMSQLREERKRRKADKGDPTYVPDVPENTGKKNRNKKSDTASNKKSADCVFDVSFVFLFFSIPFLMNSPNI